MRAQTACPPFRATGGHGARCAFAHPTGPSWGGAFGAIASRMITRDYPIFRRQTRLPSFRRKTMALKLGADCGQTRGQYPAPPPERLELKGLISVRSIPPQGGIPKPLRRGRNRIDGREEALNCARHDTAVIGSKT